MMWCGRTGLGLALLLLTAVGARAELLLDRYCDPGAASVVFMLDVTTPYDDIDRSVLRDSALKVFDRLEGGQKFTILTIEDSFSHSRRLIEACIPFCPDGSILDDLFSDCTEGVLLQERRALAARLRDVLGLMLESSSELPRSDIVRTIYYAMRGDVGVAPTHVDLYVFSDMLENSGFITLRDLFAGKPSALVDMARKNDLVPSMPGASVRIFGVGRRHSEGKPELSVAEMQKLTDFWREYFTAAGAASVEISPRFDF
ncbi:MAG TPA: hypothetical protein VFK86_00130 [Bauldia sp.]|nr:hypothetical protein [Bauldia sp.]